MRPGYLNPNSRTVLIALARFENAAGSAYVRGPLLAKLTELSPLEIQRAARVLCRRNLAEYGHGGYAAMAAGREWVRVNGEK